MLFVEQKYKVSQKRDRIENGKSHAQFYRDEPCDSARIKLEN